jgi:hypothetical protein
MKLLAATLLLTCLNSSWANTADMYKSQATMYKANASESRNSESGIDHARTRRVDYLSDLLKAIPANINGQIDQRSTSLKVIINAEIKHKINYEAVFTEEERDIENDKFHFILLAKMERALNKIVSLKKNYNVSYKQILDQNKALITSGKTLKVRMILLSNFVVKNY